MVKKILIADDETGIVTVMTTRLTSQGYEVMAAFDGEEALRLTREKKPDLILLDYSMPKIKGDEVCRQIKTDPELKHIPVIFITASPGFIGHNVMQTTQADDFLIKPFRSADLLAKIRQYVG